MSTSVVVRAWDRCLVFSSFYKQKTTHSNKCFSIKKIKLLRYCLFKRRVKESGGGCGAVNAINEMVGGGSTNQTPFSSLYPHSGVDKSCYAAHYKHVCFCNSRFIIIPYKTVNSAHRQYKYTYQRHRLWRMQLWLLGLASTQLSIKCRKLFL